MELRENRKKIVFITQSLERNGSEILLFNFINYIAGTYNVSVICYKRGSLISQLDPTVKVHILGLKQAKSLIQKISRRLRLQIYAPLVFWQHRRYMWYINTVILPLPVKYAAAHGIKFLLHVHELNKMYAFLSASQLRVALESPAVLIANSQITRAHLLAAGAKAPIPVIYPFIDIKLVLSYRNKEKKPTVEKTWVMSGSIDENKNPELLIKIASESQKNNLKYKYKWLYNSVSDDRLLATVQREVNSQNLPVKFIKSTNFDDYMRHFSSADGFILTSTSESFSIATLEALTLTLPLVINDCEGVKTIVDESVASIIELDSSVAKYLTAMKSELERGSAIASEKLEKASAFDASSNLLTWKNALSAFMD